MSIFNPDGPFIKYMTLLFDAMLVGVLWLLMSLPIVTMGAATAASYYVMMRRISNREKGIIKDFFSAFRSNLKQATGFFLILLAFFAVNLFNFLFTDLSGTSGIFFLAFYIIFAIEIVFLFIHAFPLMSRFEMPFLQLVKMTLLMAHKHLLTTITNAALIIGLLYLIIFVQPLLILVGFGLYCWVSSLMFVWLYRKYHPELDSDDEDEEENKN